MHIDMIVDMSVVSVNRIRIPGIVVRWIVTPIPWRVIRSVIVSPENIEYYRSCYIYRFIDVVGTIHINITYYLNLHVVIAVSLHFNCCNVLIDITFQNRLDDNQVGIVFYSFDNP